MIQIDSLERPRFTLTGDRSPHFVEALRVYRGKWRGRREDLILSSPSEKVLTSDNQRLLADMEQESRSYYQHKLSVHKVEGDPIEDVRVLYVDEVPGNLRTALNLGELDGVFLGEVDLVLVKVSSNEPEGILSASRVVHHELGHAVGTSERRIAMGGKEPKHLGRNGFGRIIRNQVKGQAIEEGLVTLDEVDYYRSHLSKVFPRSFTPEQVAAVSKTHNSLKDIYDISRDDMNAFVSITDQYDPNGIEIAVKSIEVYSFVKHLARFFSPQVQDSDTERLVGPRHLGRYVLDTARFNHANTIIELMRDTLSPKFANFLLDFPAWPEGERADDMLAAGGLLQQLRAESLQSQ